MRIRITPKKRGNNVAVRKAMTGKGNEIIVGKLPDGTELDGTLSKDGEWYKVDGGYVRAGLAVEVE